MTKPLEEIKELFFHEKPVEIVELARPERTEKVPTTKRRVRQKAKSKRATQDIIRSCPGELFFFTPEGWADVWALREKNQDKIEL